MRALADVCFLVVGPGNWINEKDGGDGNGISGDYGLDYGWVNAEYCDNPTKPGIVSL
jgi:hypothetical protein